MKRFFLWFKSKLEYWKLRAVLFLKIQDVGKRFYANNERSTVSREFLKAYIAKWGKLTKIVNRQWADWYFSCSGKENINYVPEDIYYVIIEPILNDMRMAPAYGDKNLYDKLFPKGFFPEAVLRNINGVFFDGEYRKSVDPLWSDLPETRLFVKPTRESSGGRQVEMFAKDKDGQYYNKDRQRLDRAYLDRAYKKNYIVQKAIEPHPFYAKLGSSSVNTIRVLTYRSVRTDEIIILGTFLRVGPNGAVIDNQNAGGIVCEIDPRGFLLGLGFDKFGNKVEDLFNGLLIKGVGPLLGYGELLEAARTAAGELPYCRILGLDMCLDSSSRVRIIEINTQWLGVAVHQWCGNAMLGAYTDEIIDYCAESLRQGLIVY